MFWENILQQEDDGEKKFFEGRDLEATDINKACDRLQESFKIYDAIMDEIDKKRKFILKAKFKYVKVTMLSQISGFFIGILASMAASWILGCLFKM